MTGPQEYISRTQPNWAALTPTVARVLDPTLSARSIRKLLLVGEMVRESDIAEWTDPGVQVYNVYGPAENNLITTAAKAIRGRASSVGTGINIHTWVVDVKNKRLVPIEGRVEISDIESYTKSHNAAILVPEAGPIKNKLTAVLEGAGSPGQPLAVSPCDPGVAHQVQQALRDNLPSYMCPSTWISVKHLPLASSGKLDRKVLTNKLETLCHEEYLGLILDHAQDEDDQHGHEDDDCRRILREGCIQVLNIPVERIAISKAFAAHGGLY
ncbi:non-ribosomal peptide synthetase [Fusarium globosum]|uniref:Non-ribosomal peptide synthetase n=1 Tax=Fusarium globosum TaxID=78864 RepID=A0A8H5YCY1_9HYPO|nr:non-ribosomal peptide synthetase [Fusarium globosum]